MRTSRLRRCADGEVAGGRAVTFGAGALDPQGPVAEAMADLWWFMLALGIVVFAIFAVLLAVGLARRTPDGEESRRVRFGRWLVGGGVVMPTIVVIVVFGATVVAMRAVPTRAGPEALEIEVVGHQFWWEITYPDTGVTTRNELHLPVGRPVELQLTSADVIHSFWVPALGGKMDLLPDGVNTLVLEAAEPGEHRSVCAEFCGLEHAAMVLRVVAEPAAEFESWIADRQESGG